MKKIVYVFICCILLFVAPSYASLIIPMYSTDSCMKLGVIIADDTIYGLVLTPKLRDLSPGIHGFQVYQLPLCNNHGLSAGNHYDPVRTFRHRGPYRGDGHLGDLPVLIANSIGKATLPILAPRLKLADIRDHALIIHAGADNYSDKPFKNGRSSGNVACGIVPFH